jgi:hypothetical protein
VQFKYLGREEREIPALSLVVGKGDTFEATGAVAEGLLGQTDLFERTDTPKKEK